MREDLRYIENLIEDIEYASHPSDKALADFIDKKLEDEAKEELVKHLIHCYRCREVVKEVVEYKKKSRPINNILVATPFIALVSSLIIFVYFPSSSEIIGMIDLSKSNIEWRAEEKRKENKIIDGDKFLKEIIDSTNLSYLIALTQAEQESDLGKALDLYQLAINNISGELSDKERLKQKIILRSYMLRRMIQEGNEIAIRNYRNRVKEDIRKYYFYQKE